MDKVTAARIKMDQAFEVSYAAHQAAKAAKGTPLYTELRAEASKAAKVLNKAYDDCQKAERAACKAL